MGQLRLLLLGTPQIQRNGTAVQVQTRKAVALLAYLAVTGDIHSRDSMAALLWPQFDQQRARTSLRNTLSLLKRVIGADWLTVDRQAVGLNWDRDVEVDVHQFRRLNAQTDTPDHVSALESAISLYRDDFLAGFTLPDSPAFDEWQFFETEHLRQELAQSLATIILRMEANGQSAQAIPYARRWVHVDSLHEPAHYHLMKLYAQTGQRAAALRQFDICQHTLIEMLGIAPGDEIVALHKQVQHQSSAPPQEPLKVATPGPEFAVHHAPVYATSFVGRQAEMAQLADHLTTSQYPLVTITGTGGIGKTRLALQVIRQLTAAFTDGIYYIDLAPLRSVHQLLPTIITALSLSLHGPDTPQAQLIRYLQHKKILLVLDNFEHLMNGVDMIVSLLQSAPDIHLLITSREVLNLHQEWVYPLHGLPVPDPSTTMPAAMFSSVQLFIQRARQLCPDFAPTVEEKDVVKICQLVEGMPLGIELAAAWIRLLPCHQIAQQIESNIDFLTSMQRDTDDRHRSLRAVFAHSWALLSPAEQQAFAQCSLFRGGATLAAVQAVTQAPLFTLYGLVNKSLLRLEENGRYTLHELMRQFASEKLSSSSELQPETMRRYCHYYAGWLQQQEPHLFDAQQEKTLNSIKQDIANVRQAWEIAGRTQDLDALKQSLHSLYCYHMVRSYYSTGQELFQQAADALAPYATTEEAQTILAKLLARQGEFTHMLGQANEAKLILQKSLAYAEPMQAFHEIALCGRLLGLIAYRQGLYQEAQAYLTQAIPLTQQLGEEHNHALLLLSLGAVEQALGHYGKAEANHTACLHLYQRLNYQWGIAHALRFLGKTAYHLQAFARAKSYYEESYHLCQTIQHEAGMALVLNDLGLLYLTQGQYDEAHEALQKALALSHTSQAESVRAETLKNLGALMIAWQELAQARGYLRQALQTAVSAQATPIMLAILLEMTQVASLPSETTQKTYAFIQQHPAADWTTHNKARQWQKNLPHPIALQPMDKVDEDKLFVMLIETYLT